MVNEQLKTSYEIIHLKSYVNYSTAPLYTSTMVRCNAGDLADDRHLIELLRIRARPLPSSTYTRTTCLLSVRGRCVQQRYSICDSPLAIIVPAGSPPIPTCHNATMLDHRPERRAAGAARTNHAPRELSFLLYDMHPLAHRHRAYWRRGEVTFEVFMRPKMADGVTNSRAMPSTNSG